MVSWVLVFIVLVVAGLGVVGWFGWRLFGDVRHFGSAVADASARLAQATEALDGAKGPASRPGAVPRARTASGS